MHDRTPRTLSLSLTCLNIPTDKTITQTIFVAQFTSGSFPHLGETPGHPVWHLPRYSSATISQLTISSHYRYNMEWVITNSFPKAPASGGGLPVTLGVPWHLSITESVSCCLYNPFRALLPHQPKGLGGCGEVPQWCCLPSGFNQGSSSGGQGIWPFCNMGEPLSSQNLYHWGSSQATDPPGFYGAWLALCLSAA